MLKYLKLLFTNHYFITLLWFGLSLFAGLKQALHQHINNYIIYRYTFINSIHQHTLYLAEPQLFADRNHYGPLFALLIAPFSLLPDTIGVLLWVIFNAWVLYKAILMLPLSQWQRSAVLLICAHELMTASFNVQFNPAMAALIIFSFVFIRTRQEIWAALAIAAGFYIKLYGVVGLAFFFFTPNKLKFIMWLVIWGAVLFILPMALSSPRFVVQCYHDWYDVLVVKNAENVSSTSMQDISVMGMIRRIFQYPELSNAIVIGCGLVIFGLSYLNIKRYPATDYQLLLLASTLIFTVIFSTSSESPTYIIAFVGVAVWFVSLDRPVTGLDIGLLVFALLITSLSPSDLFPRYINTTYIKPYALKALPCFVIWLRIVYDSLNRKFNLQPAYAAS